MSTHPGQGTYRLTPDEQWNQPAYDVEVNASDECVRTPLSPYPWNENHEEFRFVASSGWKFIYRCYGDRYGHWAIDPGNPPEVPVSLIELDSGDCEAV